ncbi:YfhJ family protein [Priestia koreensis]|uniref:YfhJ family protein n=1 Tax=Priestia koreensis TaxID=284581 RepID=UPI0034582EA2
MEDIFERLTNQLLSKNESLSYEKGRTWVEMLWGDFEATYAKAGYEYKGMELTEKIVTQWIEQYGDKLHEIQTRNPKFKKLLEADDQEKKH